MTRPFTALLCAFFLIGFFISLILCILIFRNKYRYFWLAVLNTVLAFVFTYVYLSSLRFYDYGAELSELQKVLVSHMVGLPVLSVIILILIILSVICRKELTGVSDYSIYFGINKLESGFCVYREDGRMMMVNEKMDELSYKATGSYLYDGLAFRDFLNQHLTLEHEIEIGDSYYFCTFHTIVISGKNNTEIILTDITSEHHLNNQLAEETKRRYEYQEKLKQYSLDMADLIRTEEILNAKVKTHAEFGNLLLHGKYSLSHPEERESFLKSTENILTLSLSKEKEENNTDELLRIAHSFGIDVHINGMIEKIHENAVLQLLQECITNCAKHSDGHNLYLDVLNVDNKTEYICYNDGVSPNADIIEGGGLSAIRNITEKMNGECTSQ